MKCCASSNHTHKIIKRRRKILHKKHPLEWKRFNIYDDIESANKKVHFFFVSVFIIVVVDKSLYTEKNNMSIGKSVASS